MESAEGTDEGTATSTLDQRERVAEAAILVEYLAIHALSADEEPRYPGLAQDARARRDGLISELARMLALPESKVRDRVMGATVNVAEHTWRVYQAASWVAHL